MPERRMLPKIDGFYVYTHARPDGSVFYVGKGRNRRAWDFSPSRRKAHHRNIVNKYGHAAIIVTIYPAASEDEAFATERRMIAEMRAAGVKLINLTNGGEGASGAPMTPARLEGLARGRANRVYAGPGFDRFVAAGRLVPTWLGTDAHKAKASEMACRAVKTRLAAGPKQVVCTTCGTQFESFGQRAWSCSKACQLRSWRAKQKAAKPPAPPKMRADNTTGMTGVYFNKKAGKWLAMIGQAGKLVYLGRFATQDEAAAARREAEKAVALGNLARNPAGLSAAA